MPKVERRIPSGDRLADEELPVRFPLLVEEVDDPVVASLEAVVMLGQATHRERGIEHVWTAVVLIVLGIEDLERVAAGYPSLQIEVVERHLDDLVEDGPGNVVLEPGLVDAVEEPQAAIGLVGLLVLLGVGGTLDLGRGRPTQTCCGRRPPRWP